MEPEKKVEEVRLSELEEVVTKAIATTSQQQSTN
jgi:hypothetical protein